jgi:hypothetical protein
MSHVYFLFYIRSEIVIGIFTNVSMSINEPTTSIELGYGL